MWKREANLLLCLLRKWSWMWVGRSETKKVEYKFKRFVIHKRKNIFTSPSFSHPKSSNRNLESGVRTKKIIAKPGTCRKTNIKNQRNIWHKIYVTLTSIIRNKFFLQLYYRRILWVLKKVSKNVMGQSLQVIIRGSRSSPAWPRGETCIFWRKIRVSFLGCCCLEKKSEN